MSGYENVKLWFAKDENDSIITIDDINEQNRQGKYLCPVCGSHLKPKAVKSKQVTSHFAHIDASKCNSESQIHFWFKHRFLEKGDKFTVISDVERDYVVKNILVEELYETEYGVYKPDVTIITECDNTIYFEMAFTNKKKIKDYLDIWLELKNIVVEVDIKQLMFKEEFPTFKALFYEGKCFNVKRNDTYYNIIGKYKEDKLKGGIDDEIKERIRKLDWFWDDTFRYKKGEVDIEYMVDLIDNIDGDEKEVINKILKKQSCSQLVIDCNDFKREKYMKEFMKVERFITEKYGDSIKIISEFNEYYPSYNIESNLREKQKFNCIGYRSGGSYSNVNIEYELQYIEKCIAWEIEDINKTKIQYKITKNKYLLNTIDTFNIEIKEIDNKYSLKLESYSNHNYNPYDVSLRIKYGDYDNYSGTSIKDKQLFESDDIAKMKGFMYKILNERRKNKNTIKDINQLRSIIEELILYLNKITNGFFYHDGFGITNDNEESLVLYFGSKYFNDVKITVVNHYLTVKTKKNRYINVEEENKIYYKDVTDFQLKLQNLLINIINAMKIECKSCYSKIDLNMKELEYFYRKGLNPPKRCKSCRTSRKQNKED